MEGALYLSDTETDPDAIFAMKLCLADGLGRITHPREAARVLNRLYEQGWRLTKIDRKPNR